MSEPFVWVALIGGPGDPGFPIQVQWPDYPEHLVIQPQLSGEDDDYGIDPDIDIAEPWTPEPDIHYWRSATPVDDEYGHPVWRYIYSADGSRPEGIENQP